MPGSEGMERMKALMARVRSQPPRTIAGLEVVQVRDYLHNRAWAPGGVPRGLEGPTGDLVMLDLAAEGNCLAIRPSGTEPQVKFYMFAYEKGVRTIYPGTESASSGRSSTEDAGEAKNSSDPFFREGVPAAKAALHQRLAAMESELRGYAGA
jgi:hypothetical protein